MTKTIVDARDNYDDIIDLPHPVSKTHPRMSEEDRAAQFAPFAALTGHDDAVKKTAEEYEEETALRHIPNGRRGSQDAMF